MAKDLKKIRIQRRKRHVRKILSGTGDCPRLTVTKSLRNIHAQIIDDEKMITLAACSSLSKDIAGKASDKNKTKVAALVGEALAKTAIDKGISTVAFDRNGNLYHGRVKALADAARKAGLKF
jgi:large subunit ribosomal protein L18